ncbi:DHHA1 domain-containing protein [Patescibacteria group bacterium]|nr:DHHA1 domain-containing protein [Patescibacteria group bacterium]
MKSIVIFYHSSCPDGFSAAWAAWKKFGNKAQYVPIPASQTKEQLGGMEVEGREVYFLDSCASVENLQKLTAANLSVTVIDHHLTNRDRSAYVTNFIFGIKHSGAVLAWKYFHPDKDVPLLLKYVEDNDLWKFKLPNNSAIGDWIGLANFGFKDWDKYVRQLEHKETREKCVAEGQVVGAYKDSIVRDVLEHAYEVDFLGCKARVANESVGAIHSQVGHLLLDKDHPVAIVWYENGRNRKYSLRSKGDMDVAKLAAKFPGGGGHKHAAGFTLPATEPFPWKPIRK